MEVEMFTPREIHMDSTNFCPIPPPSTICMWRVLPQTAVYI